MHDHQQKMNAACPPVLDPSASPHCPALSNTIDESTDNPSCVVASLSSVPLLYCPPVDSQSVGAINASSHTSGIVDDPPQDPRRSSIDSHNGLGTPVDDAVPPVGSRAITSPDLCRSVSPTPDLNLTPQKAF